MTNPNELNLVEAASLVREGDLSARELLEACLERIAETDAAVGAFAAVGAEAARREAVRLDSQPPSGPLHGVPIALKDLIFTSDMNTEANCEAFADFRPEHDATVVRRLREAGAIIVGKTNTHELAYGVSCPASRNPWDLQRMTGGSSGGSAAALAARMTPGALGTDTGGSVRIPSTCCGTTGIKTTAGLVPRDGLHMISTTYDTVGPMARTAADCALLLEVIAGPSRLDPYSRPVDSDGVSPVSSTRLGVPGRGFYEGIEVDSEVMDVVAAAIDHLTGLLGGVKEIAVPNTADHFEAGAAIVFAESAHLLAGIREASPEKIGAEPRQIMDMGAAISAPDLAGAYDALVRFRQRYRAVFSEQEVDLFIAPVIPVQTLDHGTETYGDLPLIPALTQFCFPVNGAGLPAIALPGGFASDGLPVGFQLVGRPGADLHLARVGEMYQETTDWHRRSPDL